ncbi:MAG: caspase family protein [Methanomassiliicoccales archaeon]|jgi:hypothetical protein
MSFFDFILELLFGGGKTKTTTTTGTVTQTTTTKQCDQKKQAICIGINKYPNPSNNLHGCVNDAKEWALLLTEVYGFMPPKVFLDNQATKYNVSNALIDLVNSSKPGDILALTNSSHGSSVPDQNGDEEDRRDEAICLYDSFWIDDEIRDILSKLDPQVSLTFITDSCYSGTVTREFILAMGDKKIRPRYLPPEDNQLAKDIVLMQSGQKIFYPQENMKEVLISGCSDKEYSYDANFSIPMGAFSHFAIDVLRSKPNVTYKEFYALLRTKLPSSQYPQTPQLEGAETNLNKLVFS